MPREKEQDGSKLRVRSGKIAVESTFEDKWTKFLIGRAQCHRSITSDQMCENKSHYLGECPNDLRIKAINNNTNYRLQQEEHQGKKIGRSFNSCVFKNCTKVIRKRDSFEHYTKAVRSNNNFYKFWDLNSILQNCFSCSTLQKNIPFERRKLVWAKHEITAFVRNFLLTLMWMAILSMSLLHPASAYQLEPTTRVYRIGISGSSVSLPCQLPALESPPMLVLWYRSTNTKPFYSFDGREHGGKGSHKIHDQSPLGKRSKFTPFYRRERYEGVVGDLELKDLSREDAGNYTCRVEFYQSPTMMSLLTLDVHERIQKLTVVDIYENEVINTAGPYEEQSALYLKCRATGGFPQPVLEWIIPSTNTILSEEASYGGQSSFTSSSYTSAYAGTGRVEAILQVAELRRADQGREFTCRANNSLHIEPSTKTVSLDIYYGPVVAEIRGLEKPIKVGEFIDVECITGGSRPPPIITWSPERLFNVIDRPVHLNSGNVTISRAKIITTWEDDQTYIKCTATNSKVPKYSISAAHVMNVHYSPRVEIALGAALDPNNINEFGDVYFQCLIKANPTPRSIEWLHKDTIVKSGPGPGGKILIHGSDLVFQGILREAEGDYRCRASNELGSSISDPIYLHVQYAPECSTASNVTVSVSPDEETTLSCTVNSSSDNVNFRWAVNTSKGLTDFEDNRYTVDGLTSYLTYRPYSYQIAEIHTNSLDNMDNEDDLPEPVESFGVVFCWAENLVGWQMNPCLYSVKPAGPPGELSSCSLVNQSATSLAVSCNPGHDGGLTQKFSVLVEDEITGKVESNVSSNSPDIVITNLAPGRDYLIRVRAFNAKGVSSAITLQGFALKVAENKIHAIDESPSNSLLLPVFAGVLSALLLVATLLFITARLRQHRTRRADNADFIHSGENAPLSTSPNDGDATNREELDNRSSTLHLLKTDIGKDSTDSATTILRSYVPISPSSDIMSSKTPDYPGKAPSIASYQAMSCRSTDLIPSSTPPLMDSPSLDDIGGSNLSSSLGKKSIREQPLMDRMSSPSSIGSGGAAHQYYTLKINCTRRHNESFV